MGVEKCYKTINRQGDVGVCKDWLWMSYALIWVLGRIPNGNVEASGRR